MVGRARLLTPSCLSRTTGYTCIRTWKQPHWAHVCDCLRAPYLVAVNDGVETVSHHDDSLAPKQIPHDVLD